MLKHLKTWIIDNILVVLPDKIYLQIKYLKVMHRTLHLKNPRSFNEKIQWLKLYNRRPEYTMMVDKFAVKNYIEQLIGGQYLIQTIGVWESPEEIEWNKLPNQFVLKTTHGGGNTGVIICKDKSNFNTENAIKKLHESLDIDLYKRFREWPYKNIHKRIIAEEYIQSEDGDLKDYKFLCFNGECKYFFICSDRKTNLKIDFFDINWNHMPFIRGHENSDKEIHKPVSFDKMIDIAEKIAKEINVPLVRIDLYNINGRIYFGEITFFPASGMEPFQPEEWDYILGDQIQLPLNK